MLSKLKRCLPTLVVALAVYIFLYGFYLSLSVGIPDKTVYLQARRYIPCALAVALALQLWRQARLPVRKLWPHTLVSLAWILTYPVSCWIPFHLNTSFIDNHHDIAIGAYLFCGLVCFHLLLLRFRKTVLRSGYIMGILQALQLVLPVTQI